MAFQNKPMIHIKYIFYYEEISPNLDCLFFQSKKAQILKFTLQSAQCALCKLRQYFKIHVTNFFLKNSK